MHPHSFKVTKTGFGIWDVLWRGMGRPERVRGGFRTKREAVKCMKKLESRLMSDTYVIKVTQDRPYDDMWDAYEDNLYDVDCDQDGYFDNGYKAEGKTKWEAIRNLIEVLEDKESE